MYLFSSFLIAVFLTVLLMPLLMHVAGRLHLLDEPCARKVHAAPIPRCGGIGLAVGAMVPVLLWLPIEKEFAGLLIGGAGMVLLGLLDDAFDLNYKWKFLGQFAVAAVAIHCGIVVSHIHYFGFESLPDYVAYPLTALFLVGVTNAVNMSDGLDGLAAGIVLLTLAMIAVLAYPVGGKALMLVAMAVMGGSLGFLRYNTHPAMLFLGDAGSQFLGFMAASLAILLTQKVHQPYNAALPLLLLGLPILDTLSVMIQRIRNRKSLFFPDNRHTHHKLLARGLRHPQAVAVVYIIQSVFLGSAFLVRYEGELLTLLVFFAISAMVLAFFYLTGKINWRLRSVADDGGSSERRNLILRKSSRLYRWPPVVIKYAFIIFMVGAVWIPTDIAVGYSHLALYVLAIFLAALCVSPRKWTRGISKLGLFLTIICIIHATILFPSVQWVHVWMVDLYLVALTVLLLLAIRMTRKTEFRPTTQDLLILLLVVGVMLLIGKRFHQLQIDEFITRLAVLGYAVEYLFRREPVTVTMLNATALFSLAVIGTRGLV